MDLVGSLWRLGLSLAAVAAAAWLAFALRDPERRGRRASWLVPAFAWLALVGVPGFLAPVLSVQRLRVLAGVASLAGAAWLATRARRGWSEYERAAASARVVGVQGAFELLAGEREADVALRGRLGALPALVAPLSARPCVLYRLEVRRGAADEPADLVAFVEERAEQATLDDGAARLGLALPVLRARGVPLETAVLEGEFDAGAGPGQEGTLAELVRRFDPDPPGQGRMRYRFVERALVAGTPVAVAGHLARAAGGPVLTPIGGRLFFGDAGDAFARTLRSSALRRVAAAACAAAAGGIWLWPG